MNIRSLIAVLGLVIGLGASAATAATLGLVTSAPTIGAEGDVEYLEFGPDGDVSMFGGVVTGSSLTTLDVPSAEMDFGIGFDLADPVGTASGGFSVFDAGGEYLSGDLLAVGFRSLGAFRSLIEFQFGNLTGRGTFEWTDTLLMNVILPDPSGDPFSFFVDGDVVAAQIGVFAVVGGGPSPNPIPLPAGAWLLLVGLSSLYITRRCQP